jgi:hypothetical protein
VPADRLTGELRSITKLGPFVKVSLGREWSSVSGKLLPLFEYTLTLTDVAGPGPLKYSPATSTVITPQVWPLGTTKSSASSSSYALNAFSKFCELDEKVPGLSSCS